VSFYLGVDAGGTKTEYLLGDDDIELGRVRTGTIKLMRTDEVTAAHNLETGLAELTSRTGVSMQALSATCIGAAGFSVPLVGDWMRSAFASRISGSICLVGDVEIALDAAFAGAPGIVAIAGTGSNVAGRDIHSAVSTVGGWGPALADQASGHRVGLEALRALFLALDAETPTTLLETILGRWKLENMHRLVEAANRFPSPDFSELAPVVVGCAEGGDAVATAVLQQEAEEMAHLVQLMITRLRRSSRDQAWLPEIAFAGSMLQHVPMLREFLISALHQKHPLVHARDGVVDPLLGALWRARTQLSYECSGQIRRPNDLYGPKP